MNMIIEKKKENEESTHYKLGFRKIRKIIFGK